ncbi:MAG TPA: 1-(5-phosphoribosyl)-5-[(5-phosphoribosylamino)methylideneamino]imidazole-4-carboxamide isomerase [Deltaproteobacteria bacterium]|nr:MAG: 1-(5-phosphoribosyl)-5-[(5-phosphoribosylamino)methylideneamino]imidazole-4-carboxamide isomerase [Deltaproteobacteria bacterium]HDM32507.1 1-(5-phosphoribosyl)-5-[(5-phosphoribosylamino)methylideneamino]imidazole-4-carboxamide isomerase [Deltaproteobacteria bacterium]
MIVIPAIDLHDGKVVRLKQGRFDMVKEYSNDPVSVAMEFNEAGAMRIHIVDLDASLKGRSVNTAVIESICRSVSSEIEVGGGVRGKDDAARLLDMGVDFIILGTVIVKDPDLAAEIISAYPSRIGLGIDAKDGKVAVSGWTEETTYGVKDVLKMYEGLSPAFVVYTDIKRDGMLTGPNIEATSSLVSYTDLPVVASGGISTMQDLKLLSEIDGLMGAITGKAIYEGLLDIREAISRFSNN